MKNFLLALAAAAAAIVTAPASAVVVSMNPVAQSVAVGDTITVDFRISGLGAEILSAFDIDVVFNTGLTSGGSAAWVAAEFGGVDSYFEFDATQPGALTTLGYSLLDDTDLADDQTDGSFIFMTMTWTADADGALFLDFGASPDFARNIVGLDYASLSATFEGVCVAIGTGSCNQVPEPATFGLAGLALLGCGLSSASRRRAVPVALSA